LVIYKDLHNKLNLDNIIAFIVGILLGLGILISGFAKRRTIVGFFTFNADWNPTLIVIFGTAISLNFLFNKCIIFKRKRPIYNSKFELMHFRVIDKKLVFGSIFYGLVIFKSFYKIIKL